MTATEKILICYNPPKSVFKTYSGKPFSEKEKFNDLSETAFYTQLESIKDILGKHFTDVALFPIHKDIRKNIKALQKISPDLIFNFVESVEGKAEYEYCIAALFELLAIEFTGNTAITLGNCLNKERTKNILRSFGLATPHSLIIKNYKELELKNFELNFPVILKLLREDASIGISEYSVVENFAKLKKQAGFLLNTYNQELIAEEYIDGRELNVAILGNTVLPISEIQFKGLPAKLPKIVTYEGKWIEDSIYYKHTIPLCPAKLNKKLKKEVEDTALSAFFALNCRDYARVDIRVSKNNVPYVIEVNPNPDISIDSGFVRAASAAGISYEQLLLKLAELALARKKYDTQIKAG